MSELCWKVNIIESESGWGQKIDEVKEFDRGEDNERNLI